MVFMRRFESENIDPCKIDLLDLHSGHFQIIFDFFELSCTTNIDSQQEQI